MKQLVPQEAIALGVIQEVNRQVLHRLGLALAVRTDDITGISQYFIWDVREEPDGVFFGEEIIDAPDALVKARRILKMIDERSAARSANLGYGVQPIPGFDGPENDK